MGCCRFSVQVSAEEKTILVSEKLLGFSQQNFSVLYERVKKTADKGKLSCSAVEDIKKEFRLDPEGKLLESYLSDDGINVKVIVVIAVLLCRGSVRSKAEAIFETFMIASARVMSKKGFSEFVDLAADLASVQFPKSIPLDSYPRSSKEILDYLQEISANKEQVKSGLTSTLFSNNRTSALLIDFADWVEKNNVQLFSSTSLRQHYFKSKLSSESLSKSIEISYSKVSN